MNKAQYRTRNWKDYNQSLRQRGNISFWFSEEVADHWINEERTGKRGRPRYYSEMAITAALTLRQLFRLPLRATCGLVESLLKLLQIEAKTPDASVLSRRGNGLKFDLDAKVAAGASCHVVVDATGVKVMGEGEWKTLRYGQMRWSVWRKLHIAMDVDSHMILAAKTTDSARLDGTYLPELLDAIEHKVEQITGDGAYDKKGCYQASYKRGAKGVFPPQHNAIVQRNKLKKDPALLIRDEAIEFIKQGDAKERRSLWKKQNDYHKRSLVESMMARIKKVFGDQVSSRNIENQHTDLMLRCRAINHMNQLGRPVSVPI